MKVLLLLAAAVAQAAAPPAGKGTGTIDGLPIAPIGRQSLPARGCAAYLFSTGQTRVLAAMASVDPATLRIAVDGPARDFPRVAANGVGPFGFPTEARYQAGDVTATLEMTIQQRENLTGGAMVPSAALTIERPGQDVTVIPLAGMIGCRT